MQKKVMYIKIPANKTAFQVKMSTSNTNSAECKEAQVTSLKEIHTALGTIHGE